MYREFKNDNFIEVEKLETAKMQCAEIIKRASNDNQKKLLPIYERLEREISQRQKQEDLLSKILNQ
ncbi:hypothetical protein [Saccharicrinis aurantiacus]|uniref:hypothetical protein n=1 Tax=Saccharicrinis aurantiacus TaxID=1849719 RepID=UPI00249321E4|nr:hypothetical protein [Saccharicrinis aurantiacus]